MSIMISSELVLIGIFTKSQKTIKPEYLWHVSQSFYKINEEFLVDISEASISSTCFSRSNWFIRDFDGNISPSPEKIEKFKNGQLFELFLKSYKKAIKKQIKKVFRL